MAVIPAANQSASEKVIRTDDSRLSRAIFTLRETAGYLEIPESTIHAWARPATGEPLITVFPRRGAQATVPFIGLPRHMFSPGSVGPGSHYCASD